MLWCLVGGFLLRNLFMWRFSEMRLILCPNLCPYRGHPSCLVPTSKVASEEEVVSPLERSEELCELSLYHSRVLCGRVGWRRFPTCTFFCIWNTRKPSAIPRLRRKQMSPELFQYCIRDKSGNIPTIAYQA